MLEAASKHNQKTLTILTNMIPALWMFPSRPSPSIGAIDRRTAFVVHCSGAAMGWQEEYQGETRGTDCIISTRDDKKPKISKCHKNLAPTELVAHLESRQCHLSRNMNHVWLLNTFCSRSLFWNLPQKKRADLSPSSQPQACYNAWAD